VCVALCTIATHNIAQNRPDIFPLNLQMTTWIKLPLDWEVGLGASNIVLLGIQFHLPKKGHSSPHFSAHVYRGQTAEWIKMPFGMEVGLGAGHIVLDGGPSCSLKRGTAPPHFSSNVYCGPTAGWIKMPLSVRRYAMAQTTLCLMGTVLLPKGHSAPSSPQFSVHVY